MNQTPLHRFNTILFYPIAYAVWLAVAIRGVALNFTEGHILRWEVVYLLLAYGLLLGTERWITHRLSWYAGLYLFMQAALVTALAFISIPLDFFAALLLPLCGQAMLQFPRRTGYAWVAFFIVVIVITLVYRLGPLNALPLLLLYAAGYVFVATYANVTTEADAARRQSEGLLSELQAAHGQLQEYANQVEELAVLKERNRLARELHDSITQAIYALTLETETAMRQLGIGDKELALAHLGQVKNDGQQALREMRLLIYELRPPILEKEGLAEAIKSRIETVEGRTGLDVSFILTGQAELSPKMEMGLFRIAQEALNNILKHAQAKQVRVSLSLTKTLITLTIADDGIGFDPTAVTGSSGGGLGLANMQERAAEIGAALDLTSTPGKGTQITVEVRP